MRKYQLVEWLEEIARHPLLFKGPGGAAFALARADDLVRGYLDARREHFRILMRQIVGLLALEVAAGTALLGVGGWLVLNQQLTLGQLVAAEIMRAADGVRDDGEADFSAVDFSLASGLGSISSTAWANATPPCPSNPA